MIGELLRRSAAAWPDRVAIVDEGTELTFATLAERSARLANALLAIGISPGDRLADLQANTHTCVETEFACALAEIVRIPIGAQLDVAEINDICRDAAPSALVTGREFGELASELSRELGTIRHLVSIGGGPGRDYEQLIASASGGIPIRWPHPRDMLSISYTAGTTGAPKGCLRSNRNRLASMNAILASLTGPLGVEDAFLHVGSLNQTSGLFLLPHLVCGSRQVLTRQFDADRLPALIAEHRITGTALSPAMLDQFVAHVETESVGGSLNSLRRVAYWGDPTLAQRIGHASRVLGDRLVQFYGLGEAIAPLTVLSAADHSDRDLVGSAGRPVSGVAMRIVADNGVEVGPGVQGELMVGGDHLMAGYWSKPEATTRSFVKGWLRTGDIAWSDEGGHVYLVDRRAEMIITGGANVLPREIELVLESHRGVRECAVVGLPDKRWGEVVTAFVVPEKGVALELERLNAHCVDRLPAFKRPRWIELVDALPKGVSGNVRRGDLRDGLGVGKSRKD